MKNDYKDNEEQDALVSLVLVLSFIFGIGTLLLIIFGLYSGQLHDSVATGVAIVIGFAATSIPLLTWCFPEKSQRK